MCGVWGGLTLERLYPHSYPFKCAANYESSGSNPTMWVFTHPSLVFFASVK